MTSLEMSSSKRSMRAWECLAGSTWLAGCTLRGEDEVEEEEEEEEEEDEAGDMEKDMGLWLLRAFGMVAVYKRIGEPMAES